VNFKNTILGKSSKRQRNDQKTRFEMGCRAIEMSRRWDIAQKNVAQMMLTQVESQIFFIFLRFLDIFFIEIIGKILVGIVLNSEDFRVDSSLIEWLKKINYS